MSNNDINSPGLPPDLSVFPSRKAYLDSPYTRPKKRADGQMPEARAASHDRASMAHRIVGFLYSVSRTYDGEYWPLHIGDNIIGSSTECHVRLEEGTVAPRHANLFISEPDAFSRISARLAIIGSDCGDGCVEIGDPQQCMNYDIITIGENYELLLMLADSDALGLRVADSFLDMREARDDKEESILSNPAPSAGQHDGHPSPAPSSGIAASPYTRRSRTEDSTVLIDPADANLPLNNLKDETRCGGI